MMAGKRTAREQAEYEWSILDDGESDDIGSGNFSAIVRLGFWMLDERLAYISDQLKAVEDLLIDQSSPKIKVTQAYIEGGTVDER